MSTLLNFVVDKIKRKVDENCTDGNVGTSERILSVVAGGLIVALGTKNLIRHPLSAITGVTFGGALVYRGITGRCTVKEAINSIDKEKEEVTVIEHRYFVK